jgi:hypothetical protein
MAERDCEADGSSDVYEEGSVGDGRRDDYFP